MLFSLLIVGLLGLVSGAIVNILSDDLPHRENLKLPHYPDGTQRPVIAWLGILAFLSGNRTAATGSRLSWRHPLTEVATVLLMILTVIITRNDPDVSTVQLIFYLFYMAVFVLITVIDIEHRLILFVVIIPSAIIALADAIITPIQHKPDLPTALIGGVLGFAVFFILYLGGIVFSVVMAKIQGYDLPEVAFGYGDVMLSTVCGLILGWQPLIVAMFITVFLGALGATIYLIIRAISGRYNMFTPLPYGPYIVIGTLILLLFAEGVQDFIWAVV